MTETLTDVAAIDVQALRLSASDREHLATVLIRSLDGFVEHLTEEEFDGAWMPELDRRMKEWDDDPSVGIPGDQVMKELRDMLK